MPSYSGAHFNHLKPNISQHTTRFNIQKFYMVLALRSVLCATATFAVCIINRVVFITVVESVYSAVRTDSLYKADYVWSLKG